MTTIQFGDDTTGIVKRVRHAPVGNRHNLTLVDDVRMNLDDSIDLFVQSLHAYATSYRCWSVAFSGGKDSTTVLTLLLSLIASGRVPRPERLLVMYADTRMELPMLHASAQVLLREAQALGCEIVTVEPPMDDRFFVRMLGRGYPPPNNGFRWCVGLLKINPMQQALKAIHAANGGEKFLVLTGMRIGESAARDQRIALACDRNDGECSQGWYQQTTPAQIADVLAPALHFRVCHVADWLSFFAPAEGFSTLPVLEAYGAGIGDAENLQARTGCMRCPVAGHDTTLDRVIRTDSWRYLSPFTKLYDIYEELTKPRRRLKKSGERVASGKLGKNHNRSGALLMESRLWGLAQVKALQDEVNTRARAQGKLEVWLITPEEEARIHELIAARTWPEKWSDADLRGDAMVDKIVMEGVTQPLLLALGNDM